MCYQGEWFFDDTSKPVEPHLHWWKERAAYERPPHSILYNTKVYYQQKIIEYFPDARTWAYPETTGNPTPLQEDDYQGNKEITILELDDHAETQ